MRPHASPARLALVSLVLAALACSGLPQPISSPSAATAPPSAATAVPNASAPAPTAPAGSTAAANTNTLLAIAVRIDGRAPTVDAYLGDPAQAPFTPPPGRYFVNVLDQHGLSLSLGAVSVAAGQPVPLPEALASAGGKADAAQASLLTTLGKFLIGAQLAQLNAYDAVSAGFTQPLFSKAVQPAEASLDQMMADEADLSGQQAAVLAAADALQATLPTAAAPSGRLAAPARGLKDAFLGFFGYANDAGKRARQRIVQISAGLSAGDKADAFDALRSGFKGDAQNYDDWLAQLASGKLDQQAAQMESDLRNAAGFAAQAQQANDTVGEVVKREGGELVTKGAELNVEIIKTVLGQVSPDLSKGYDLAKQGARWAQYVQDAYNDPLNAAKQLTREQLLAKINERIKSDLADCCPGLSSDDAQQIADSVSRQMISAIPGLAPVETGEATPASITLKPDQFTKALLGYLGFKNTSAPGQLGPPNWCFTGAVPDTGNAPVAPWTVAADGTLTGVCQGSIQSVKMTWDGTSSGKWDPDTGTVTWSITMNIKEAGYPSGFFIVRTLQIDGSGPVAEQDGVVSAQGTAQYTDKCDSNPKTPGLVPCNPSFSGPDAPTGYSYAGTLDWKMTFQP
jgi:hypothetical protein